MRSPGSPARKWSHLPLRREELRVGARDVRRQAPVERDGAHVRRVAARAIARAAPVGIDVATGATAVQQPQVEGLRRDLVRAEGRGAARGRDRRIGGERARRDRQQGDGPKGEGDGAMATAAGSPLGDGVGRRQRTCLLSAWTPRRDATNEVGIRVADRGLGRSRHGTGRRRRSRRTRRASTAARMGDGPMGPTACQWALMRSVPGSGGLRLGLAADDGRRAEDDTRGDALASR